MFLWDSSAVKGFIAVAAHYAGSCLWHKRKTWVWIRCSLAKHWCWSSLPPQVWEVSSLNTGWDEDAIQSRNSSAVFYSLGSTGFFLTRHTKHFLGCCVFRGRFPGTTHLGHGGFTAVENPGLHDPFRENRELCTTPECPFLRRNWNLGHLKCLEKQSLPPNPTSCTITNDTTAKGCGTPWGPSPPWEEQGRAELAF